MQTTVKCVCLRKPVALSLLDTELPFRECRDKAQNMISMKKKRNFNDNIFKLISI